jgi:hypothetical protein
MFMHLLLDCDPLAHQVAPVPSEQLERVRSQKAVTKNGSAVRVLHQAEAEQHRRLWLVRKVMSVLEIHRVAQPPPAGSGQPGAADPH